MADSTQGGFVNGEFYSFARASFSLAGNKIIALDSVNYDDAIDLEEIHGANMAPIGFGEGKYTANFKITVKKEDFDKVILPALVGGEGGSDGGDGTLYGHKEFDFAVTYAKRKGEKATTDTIKGIRIMSVNHSTSEGDKSTKIELSGKALGGIWRDGKKPVATGE